MSHEGNYYDNADGELLGQLENRDEVHRDLLIYAFATYRRRGLLRISENSRWLHEMDVSTIGSTPHVLNL